MSAPGALIVLAEYGSRAIGTATADSDHDLMGMFVEPPRFVTGIDSVDTRTENTAKAGDRSTAGDTDQVVYPLRKFATLAAAGNPTVLSLLFTPPELTRSTSTEWVALRATRDAFVSKDAGRAFLGYSNGQRQALVGARNKKTNRPELVHKHGYDTKFAYHMLRTALQGVELLTTGNLRLPMHAQDVEVLTAIRRGQWTKEETLSATDDATRHLADLVRTSDLPDHADHVGINRRLHHTYLAAWGNNR